METLFCIVMHAALSLSSFVFVLPKQVCPPLVVLLPLDPLGAAHQGRLQVGGLSCCCCCC